MHSGGKGITKSALPYKRSPPSWLKTTPQQVEDQVCKLAKKGLTPSQVRSYFKCFNLFCICAYINFHLKSILFSRLVLFFVIQMVLLRSEVSQETKFCDFLKKLVLSAYIEIMII
jgi:Flp pilus assembly protein TadB